MTRLLPKLSAWREGYDAGRDDERERIYKALDSVYLNYIGGEGRGAAKMVLYEVRNLVDPVRWPSKFCTPEEYAQEVRARGDDA